MPQDRKKKQFDIRFGPAVPPTQTLGERFYRGAQQQVAGPQAFDVENPWKVQQDLQRKWDALPQESRDRLLQEHQRNTEFLGGAQQARAVGEYDRDTVDAAMAKLEGVGGTQRTFADIVSNLGPGAVGFADTVGSVLPGVEQGDLLETAYGEGTRTYQGAKEKVRKSLLAGATGFTDAEREALSRTVRADEVRRQFGAEPILSDEQRTALEEVDQEGFAGELANIAELIALTAAGPGAVGGAAARTTAAATRGLPSLAGRAAAGAVGEGTALGLAGSARAGEIQPQDFAFGAGMGAVGGLTTRAILQNQALLRNSFARSPLGQYGARAANEFLRLRGGMTAAALQQGGPQAAFDAATASPFTEEGGKEAVLSLIFAALGAKDPKQARAVDTASRRERSRERAAGREAEIQETRKALEEYNQRLDEELRTGKPVTRQDSARVREALERQESKTRREERLRRRDELREEYGRERREQPERHLPVDEARDALTTATEKLDRVVEAQRELQEQGVTDAQQRAEAVQRAVFEETSAQRARRQRGDEREFEAQSQHIRDIMAEGREPRRREKTRDEVLAEEAQGPERAEMRSEIREEILRKTKDGGSPLARVAGDRRAREAARTKAIERGVKPEEFDAEVQGLRDRAEAATERARERLSSEDFPNLDRAGVQVLANYLGWSEAAAGTYTPQQVRDFWALKLRQSGKWKAPLKTATSEVREAEAARVLDDANRFLEEGRARQERIDELMEAGDRDVQAPRGQRRAEGGEERLSREEAAPEGFEKVTEEGRSREAVEPAREPRMESDVRAEQKAVDRVTSALEAAGVKDVGQLYEKMTRAEQADLARALQEGSDARAMEVLRPAIEKVLGSDIREMGAGVSREYLDSLASGLLRDLKGAWSVMRRTNPKALPRDVLSAIYGKRPVAERPVIERTVRRTMDSLNYAKEWLIGDAREFLETTAKTTESKEMARDLIERGDQAQAISHDFELQTIKEAHRVLSESSKLAFSDQNRPIDLNGWSETYWQAGHMGRGLKDPRHSEFYDAAREEVAVTWDVPRDMGVTNQGQPLKARGSDPYLPHVYSDWFVRELAGPETPWGKAVRESIRELPENKHLSQEQVDAFFQRQRDAFSNDIQVKTAAEKHNAIEFDREVTLRGYFEGRPILEPNANRYFHKHYRGIRDRVGFERAFESHDITASRQEWIDKGGDPRRYDEWMEAAQGRQPQYMQELAFASPDSGPGWAITKAANEVYGWFKTGLLTASAIPNILETLAGPGIALVGPRQWFKALGRESVDQLKYMAATFRGSKLKREMGADMARSLQESDQLLMNRTLSHQGASQSLLETSRILRQTVNAITNRWANRMNERLGYTAVENFFTDIAALNKQGKTPTSREFRKKMWKDVFQLTDAQLKRYFSGEASPAEIQFLSQRAGQVLFGAAQTPYSAQRSMRNPLIRPLLMFQSYASKQLRMTARAGLGMTRAYGETIAGGGTHSQAMRAAAPHFVSALATIGSQAGKGALYAAFMAMTKGDFFWDGEDSRIWKQATKRPGEFWGKSLMYGGVFGPYGAALGQIFEADSTLEAGARILGPVANVVEMENLFMGRGAYKDQDSLSERIGTYFTKRTPGGKAITSVLSGVGLADRNLKLENAISGYYEYLREHDRLGGAPRSPKGMTDEHAAMRENLRKAIVEMDAGRPPTGLILEAMKAKGEDARRVAESLEGKRFLTPDKIPAEEWNTFREYIGDDDFEAMLLHDQLLSAWARAIRDNAGKTLKKPKDYDPESTQQRYRERVEAQQERLKRRIGEPDFHDRLFVKSLGKVDELWDVVEATRDLDEGAAPQAVRERARQASGRSLRSRQRRSTGQEKRAVENLLERLKAQEAVAQ